MNLSEFDFDLPSELIAQEPAHPRNHARLLIYDRKGGKITDDYFYNLGKYLNPNTTIVLNNSKVEKCRLRFDGVEIFVLETVNPTTLRAWVRPGRKFREGAKLELGPAKVKVLKVEDEGTRIIELDRSIDDESLEKHKLTPFPPYIKASEKLAQEYQTVYSKPPGSKAAPTAGLHFTKAQLEHLSKQHDIAKLTLHVGLGTFAPLREENIKTGKLHEEWFEINEETSEILNKAKHITAVGTTSLRTLESVNKPFKPTTSTTEIFIQPGYKFKNVDSLITNFHLPKSSLIMLIAAFVGSSQKTIELYEYAIKNKYRFYSFGDAMLII